VTSLRGDGGLEKQTKRIYGGRLRWTDLRSEKKLHVQTAREVKKEISDSRKTKRFAGKGGCQRMNWVGDYRLAKRKKVIGFNHKTRKVGEILRRFGP